MDKSYRSAQKNRWKAALFAMAARVVLRLQAAVSGMIPPAARVLTLSSAFWQSRALHVAAVLDVATVLNGGPQTADRIAGEVGADPDALHRLLRFLAASGVFREQAPGVFANNPLSECLRSDTADSIRAMILMHHSPEMSRPWYEQLETGVRTGRSPFALTHGQDLFDYMDEHPDFDGLFARAMDTVESLAGQSHVTEFDWRRVRRLIDVGGSNGLKAYSVLKKYPDLKAVIVDRPNVIAEARTWWQEHALPELQSRASFQIADVREDLPIEVEHGDTFFISEVLHGFDDADVLRVLGTVRRACGALKLHIVIAELVLPDQGASAAEAGFDMQMFMGTRGRERTVAEWRSLFDAACLDWQETVDLVSFAKLMVVTPRS